MVSMEEFLRLGMAALKDQAAGHFYSCGIGRDPKDKWKDDNVLEGAIEEGNALN